MRKYRVTRVPYTILKYIQLFTKYLQVFPNYRERERRDGPVVPTTHPPMCTYLSVYSPLGGTRGHLPATGDADKGTWPPPDAITPPSSPPSPPLGSVRQS